MSREPRSFSTAFRFVLFIAALGLALTAIRAWAGVINAILLSVVITLMVTPLLYWLDERGLPRWLSLLLTLTVLLVIVLVLSALVLLQVNALAQQLPAYAARLEGLRGAIDAHLQSLGLPTLDAEGVSNLLGPTRLFGLLTGFLTGLFGAFSNIFLVLLIVAFFLADAFRFPLAVVRQAELGNVWCARLTAFSRDIRRYVSITATTGAMVAILNTGLLLAVGVDFALLWGVMSFLFSFIPTIGFWLALIPPLTLAFLEHGWPAALAVFGGYVLFSGLADNIIKPRYLGQSLNLSPAVVLLSLALWGSVLGPVGAILAVPITLAIKELVIEADPASAWIGELAAAKSSQNARAPKLISQAKTSRNSPA